MAFAITRLAEDQSLYSVDSPSSTQVWLATGTEDETEVRLLIDNNVPAYDDFLTTVNPLGNPFIDATPEHKGGGIWIVTVRYGQLAPLATGRTRWDWDATGGREKIYQSKQTRNKVLSDSAHSVLASLIDFKGAIGVTETEVQGVEIVVPKLGLTARRRYASNQIVSTYFDTIRKKVGFVNAEAWTISFHGQSITFAIGEALFEGCTLTPITEDDDGVSGVVEIAYHFTISEDRTTAKGNAVNLVDFDIENPVQKPGWDYAWIAYMQAPDANREYRIKPAFQYQTERVYDSTDFSAFLLD